jgi:hypothetical protein
MTRRCWPLSVFGIDEELVIKMKNQMGNIKKGKKDIAIQPPADRPATRLVSRVYRAINDPLNTRSGRSWCSVCTAIQLLKILVLQAVWRANNLRIHILYFVWYGFKCHRIHPELFFSSVEYEVVGKYLMDFLFDPTFESHANPSL